MILAFFLTVQTEILDIPAFSVYGTRHVPDFLNCTNSKCFDLLSYQVVTLGSNFLFRKCSHYGIVVSIERINHMKVFCDLPSAISVQGIIQTGLDEGGRLRHSFLCAFSVICTSLLPSTGLPLFLICFKLCASQTKLCLTQGLAHSLTSQ